jgi:hypothetical protein
MDGTYGTHRTNGPGCILSSYSSLNRKAYPAVGFAEADSIRATTCRFFATQPTTTPCPHLSPIPRAQCLFRAGVSLSPSLRAQIE